jgi:xanthine/CO dehydrogenase XdhC/CoxF family maturation factor
MGELTTYTDAPEAYDYGYSTDTGVRIPLQCGARTVTVREVATPEDMVTYQRDRYSSGMYMVLDFAGLLEATPGQVA